MDKSYDVITYISKYLYFKKTYADIIKIVTMFVKKVFED